MAGVSLVGVHAAGGIILGGGQSFVKVDGRDIAIVGDPVAPHGEGPHANAVMQTGSTLVKISGNPVCREGDRASCNHAANGLDWFDVTG